MKSKDHREDLTLLLVLLAVFLFHSPFTNWWTGLSLPWYTIFALWFLLIFLLALKQWRSGKS